MFADKAKIYGVLYNQSNSVVFGQLLFSTKKLLISWLFIGQHGCLVSIGQHFVAMRVVHLPKRTETNLITSSDQSGPNHQIGPGCAGPA